MRLEDLPVTYKFPAYSDLLQEAKTNPQLLMAILPQAGLVRPEAG